MAESADNIYALIFFRNLASIPTASTGDNVQRMYKQAFLLAELFLRAMRHHAALVFRIFSDAFFLTPADNHSDHVPLSRPSGNVEEWIQDNTPTAGPKQALHRTFLEHNSQTATAQSTCAVCGQLHLLSLGALDSVI